MKKLARQKVKAWMQNHGITLEDVARALGSTQVSAHNLLMGKTILKPRYIDALELKYPHFKAAEMVEEFRQEKGTSDKERIHELEQENMLLRTQVETLNQSCTELTHALLNKNNKQEESELDQPSDNYGFLHQTG
jgi:DNA-binding transcriptional MerR regulator